MELRLATAREIVGYKEAGIWDKMRGMLGGGQQAAEQQPTTPQFQNSQQMAQQLDQAWKSFARLYNQQVQPLNAAYKHIMNITKSLPEAENLEGGVANQIQQLISTLTEAANAETSDVQMLQDVGLAASGIAEAMGMQGGVGQADPATGRTVQHATPEENAALQGMTPQATPEVATPDLGPAAPVEQAVAPQQRPQVAQPQEVAPPIAASPQVPAPASSQSTARGRTERMDAWKKRLMQQGQTPEGADQIMADWRARKNQNAKNKRQQVRPMLMPSAASARAFVKTV